MTLLYAQCIAPWLTRKLRNYRKGDVIYLFSVYRKDMTGFKEVLAFQHKPTAYEVQQSMDSNGEIRNLDFMALQANLDKLPHPLYYQSWEQGDHTVLMFAVRLIQN